MGKYVPTAITYQESGLVKDRDAFVLADDAYQNLENIYQWRGRLKRRSGYGLIGRLRRLYSTAKYFDSPGSPWSFNLLTLSGHISGSDAPIGPPTNITTPSPHGLTTGDLVAISGVGGATNLNGTSNACTVVDALNFTVPVVTASAWTSGGLWISDRSSATAEPNANIECGSVVMVVNGVTVTDQGDGTLTGAGVTGTINYDTGAVVLTGVGAGTTTLTMGYYPTLPCMGVTTRELAQINAEQSVLYDTRYTYKFNNTSNKFDEVTPATSWSGSDSNFFWEANYWQSTSNDQYYWTTNFSGAGGDPIRIYDGSGWYDLAPALDSTGTPKLQQTRMLIPYKGRMVALNTFEGTTISAGIQNPQRARWSQNGAPFSSVASGTAPTALNEWRSDVKGRGGFVDAPTNEHIISAQFIRDTLIVGFEHSTWNLRYTGNEILPFVWDRINKELGSESTFSMVPFDRGILAIGDKSINSCDGNNVERIDDAIPDEVFKIHNTVDPNTLISDGPLRVHGIRDFFEKLVYWTFPNAATQAKFPDRLLVFNYHNQTWAIFRESFTALGKFQRFNDVTWADLAGVPWSSANFSWATAQLQSQFPSIIAGNQHGFVRNLTTNTSEQYANYVVTPAGRARLGNTPSLYISNIVGGTGATRITVTNHNLQDSDFVMVNSSLGTGATELNGRIFQVEKIDDNTLDLLEKPRFNITAITQTAQAEITAAGHNFSPGQHFYIDSITSSMVEMSQKNGIVVSVDGNIITVDINSTSFTAYVATEGQIQNLDANTENAVSAAGTYQGCGLLTRVENFSARSKKFNMLQSGSKNFLGHVDFLAEVTQKGEVSCEVYTDYNESTPVNQNDDDFFNTVFSTQAEQFSQAEKTKEWHRFYCPTDAQFFEYNLTLNTRQMFTPVIVDSDFLLDSIIIWSETGGRLVD